MTGDGRELYFSRKNGSAGPKIQIYRATRSSPAEDWGNVGPVAELNAAGDEATSPSPSLDGTTIFLTVYPGDGYTHIYTATRASTAAKWGTPGEVSGPGAQSALDQRIQRLDSAAMLIRPQSQRLGFHHALALRVVALDQQVIARAQFKTKPVGDDLRGLARTGQRRGDDGIPLAGLQHGDGLAGLGAPGVVQGDVA